VYVLCLVVWLAICPVVGWFDCMMLFIHWLFFSVLCLLVGRFLSMLLLS
jgi:hypothetical protein